MNINEIIAAYNKAKAQESAAKKEKDKLATLIIEYSNNKEFFETDAFNVMIDTRKRTTFDTKAFYRDFPDAKEVYGTETTYKVITAKMKETEAAAG